MKTALRILMAVALVTTVLAGTAVAQTGEGEFGVCVIGVDSPCNGEQWDGDLPVDLPVSPPDTSLPIDDVPQPDVSLPDLVGSLPDV